MEYTFSYFLLFVSYTSVELPNVKHHKVIFLGWAETHGVTERETKVQPEAPTYSEPKSRSCLSLWTPSPLLATGSTTPPPHLQSHTDLQAVLELSRHTPAWGLCCSLCLEAQVPICKVHVFRPWLKYYRLHEAFPYHPKKTANIHLQCTGTTRQSSLLPCFIPVIIFNIPLRTQAIHTHRLH